MKIDFHAGGGLTTSSLIDLHGLRHTQESSGSSVRCAETR